MLRKCFLAGYFLIFSLSGSLGQDINFSTFTNQLLFNIYTNHPDNSITSFIKFYVPGLSEMKSAENIKIADTLPYIEEIHSFIFSKHPHLSIKFSRGQLAIFSNRHAGPDFNQKVTNAQLWFEFDEQSEAEIAFSRLVDNFILLSTDKRFSVSNGSQKAEFMNTKIASNFSRVQFRLTVDNVSEHRYKILFETKNSL